MCKHIPPNICPGPSKKVSPTTPRSWKPGCGTMDQYLAKHILKKSPQTEDRVLLSSRPSTTKAKPQRRTIAKDCCAGRSRSASSRASNENIEPSACAPCPVKPCLGFGRHLALNGNSQTKLPKQPSKKKSVKSKQISPRQSLSDTCVKKPVCCKSLKSNDCSVKPRSCPPKSCPASPRERTCPASGSKGSPSSPKVLKAFPNRPKSPCISKPYLMSPKASISEVCQARPRSPGPARRFSKSCSTSPRLSNVVNPSKSKSQFVLKPLISPCPSNSDSCQRTRACSPRPSISCQPSSLETEICPPKRKPFVCASTSTAKVKVLCDCTPIPTKCQAPCPPTPRASKPCPPTPCSPTPCPPTPCPPTPCSPTPCSPTPCQSTPKPKNSKHSIAKSASPIKPVTETRTSPFKSGSPLQVVKTEPDDTVCSHPCRQVTSSITFGIPSDGRGSPPCVQFRVPVDQCADCVRDVKELYFNKDVKKSDASVACEQSSNEECLQSFELSALGPCPNEIKTEPNSGTRAIIQECSSPSGSGNVCDAARAQYYHAKLLATLQILQNKEDTVRVQTESLSVAEQRIATLKIRAAQLRRELDYKNSELQKMRKLSSPCCEVHKSDASVQTQELETQKNLVKSLQNNLSVIEDLYRECFYETAKQEEVIDMLRKSYLDVRLMEKDKIDRIGRLETVINNQKWSLERCQNIAVEVEDLKLEIYNFLSNSNNDSGMWERSEASESLATEVGEDLQDIMEQLVRLRDMLTFDCTCGLKEENKMLKELNENLNMEMGDLKQRTSDLECALCQKNNDCKQLTKALDKKNDELKCMQQRLAALEEGVQDRANMCDCLTLQFKQTQVMLKEKCDELDQLRGRNAEYAQAESELRKQLAQADNVIKENCKIRCEVKYLTQQVSLWRQQLADSEAKVCAVEEELACARNYCNNIDQCYREKAASAMALQTQLEAAHARGAELCAEARRVVCAVRRWVSRMRTRDREHEDKIKEQEMILAGLEQRLQEKDPCCFERQSDTMNTSATGCSKCTKKPGDQSTGCSKCVKNNEAPSCSKSVRTKRVNEKISCRRGSGSEMTSCMYGSGSERASFSSTPVPTRKVLKKKASDERVSRYPERGFSPAPAVCEASVQGPQRSETGTCTRPAPCPAPSPSPSCCRQYHVRHHSLFVSPTRALSPSEELFERVERLHEAAEEGQRRWSRSRIHRR